MRFIGLTAAIDAALVFIAFVTLSARKSRLQGAPESLSTMVGYFSQYLTFTFIFLALASAAMLSFSGTSQAALLLIADLALWASLAYMITLTLINHPAAKRFALTIFTVLAAIGTLYQVLGLTGSSLDLGPRLNAIVANIAPLLMYLVWVPSALLFFATAARSDNPLVRKRSTMFGLGLLLVTYSWVARLQLGVVSLVLISTFSILGFALLLGGVLYRGTAQQQPSVT